MKVSYYICSNDYKKMVSLETMCVICNLYYEDTVRICCKSLYSLPKSIAVCVITPKKTILEMVQQCLKDRENVYFLTKENRGRDISALLISAKDYTKKYEYICFIHDKKPIADNLKEDTDLWIRNLWLNMIGSGHYIENIKLYFDDNPLCGLMIPPQRFGNFFHDLEYSEWSTGDFEKIQDLVQMLELKMSICAEEEPFALGTVFWCRTKALKKLFEYPWKYTDFPEEPLADDGTINHAVERCFPYVAADAGYNTVTVINEEFVPEMLTHSKLFAKKSYKLLTDSFGLRTIAEIEYADKIAEIAYENIRNGRKVCIYGAGKEGKYCLRFLRSKEIEPSFLVVSEKDGTDIVEGLKVVEINEIAEAKDNNLVIIAIYKKSDKEAARNMLKIYGRNNYCYWRADT